MSEHYIGINFVCPKCAHYHQFFIQVCIQAKRQARNHTQHHLGLNMLYNSMSLTILMPFYATDCTVLLFKVYVLYTGWKKKSIFAETTLLALRCGDIHVTFFFANMFEMHFDNRYIHV
jgi:hypothetical protein